jgi:hypothetical protein
MKARDPSVDHGDAGVPPGADEAVRCRQIVRGQPPRGATGWLTVGDPRDRGPAVDVALGRGGGGPAHAPAGVPPVISRVPARIHVYTWVWACMAVYGRVDGDPRRTRLPPSSVRTSRPPPHGSHSDRRGGVPPRALSPSTRADCGTPRPTTGVAPFPSQPQLRNGPTARRRCADTWVWACMAVYGHVGAQVVSCRRNLIAAALAGVAPPSAGPTACRCRASPPS